MFITFEGGEGSGKTTQVNRLAQYLTAQGHKTITTREPGGTPEGEKIRDLLVQREGGTWNPAAECLLLFASRVMHVESVIKPALQSGKIVISDRFTDSTRAYQGYGHGFDLEKIEELRKISIGDFEPDITFILDVDVKTGLGRSGRRMAAEALQLKQTEDRFENLATEFHERLRQGYLAIAKNSKGRYHVLDATLPQDQIEKLIAARVQDRLK